MIMILYVYAARYCGRARVGVRVVDVGVEQCAVCDVHRLLLPLVDSPLLITYI